MQRFRVTLTPPDGEPKTFETLPLEPIEIRSLMMIAMRMLTEDGWAVTFARLPDSP